MASGQSARTKCTNGGDVVFHVQVSYMVVERYILMSESR